MGKQGRVGDQFRERLRCERERRGWSQADVAKRLSDRGVPGIYPTTIAKIEAGDRGARIDEVTAVADLFAVSVDALLGRRIGLENDLAYTFRGVLDTARQSAEQLNSIRSTLEDRLRELATLDFEGFNDLAADADKALQAFDDASDALGRIAAFRLKPGAALRLRQDRIVDAMSVLLGRFIGDMRIHRVESEK
ncbi:helix-turn-helix transcriptional regulator [Mycobacterium shinjukuense]|uniref:HTH cro/C1-type domain-containing protein n=1 Tax=Mycobacterium shinjukuense TaxID=398694 RepID=A0A7I7MK77_9MYCO|nr:helix-turn-helix transcriptional regulator [Mycobacterium shinjukuense]MCV6986079.1 helix-turn-helix transcriptional regulator [Mycobacterium shinjukuense]BBX72272.1 hypothetical protein MSHI_01780 [Mycobacterium shinjukuense]